jgi:hypothetical protein
MEGINWPMWIIAFAVLLVAVGLTALMVNIILLIRKAMLLVDAARTVTGRAGGLFARNVAGNGDPLRSRRTWRAVKGAAGGLAAAARFIGRISRKRK